LKGLESGQASAGEDPTRQPRAYETGGSVVVTELRPAWQRFASCRALDPALFFPAGTTGQAVADIAWAKGICAACPVRLACLEYAVATDQQYGVWGGMTEDERRSTRRANRARRQEAAAG
jgi:WhiB family redox-sensing transcriptional regulator